jgi:protoporphyrinogen oxidase
VALTAAQRRKLPNSAFAYPSQRKYPVPTKAQARKAGISERQRLAIHRNALSRAAQKKTMGSTSKVRSVVARRAGGKVASVRGRRHK